MSIDISVLIWTIINFLLLMVLLNIFLYKPIRSLMRQRQQQVERDVEAGDAAKAELAQRRQQHEEDLTQRRQAIQAAKLQSANALVTAREAAVAAAEAQTAQKRDAIQEQLEEQEQSLKDALRPQLDDMVQALLQKRALWTPDGKGN